MATNYVDLTARTLVLGATAGGQLGAGDGTALSVVAAGVTVFSVDATGAASGSSIAAGSDITMADGKNIIVNATTGTKIGTATTQKLGFFNHAPVVQQATTATVTGYTSVGGSAVLSQSTFTGNTGAAAYTIGDIVLALKNLGFMAA